MGKHDKQEETYAAGIDSMEWYIERNHTLAKENVALKDKITELEREIGRLEMVIDNDEHIHKGIIRESEEFLKEKDDEIAVLQGQIKMLKEAVVNGALREVLA